MRSKMLLCIFLAGLMRASAGLLCADTISLTSNGLSGVEHLGAFTGTVSFTALSPTSATLEVTLTNDPLTAPGGKLVAFAFDNPGDKVTKVTQSEVDHWGLLGGGGKTPFQDTISASPFGEYDIGSSISASWLGGGSPRNGLVAGASLTWVFALAGHDLDTIQAADFNDIAVRFRGFDNGGSDKVQDPPPPKKDDTPIPEPGSLILLGAGLLGVGAASWRMKK